MSDILSRDIDQRCCEGECRSLVREGEEKRQEQISRYEYSGGSSPSVSWARDRNASPGFLGGHV